MKEKLANLIVNYSIDVEEKEKVLITTQTIEDIEFINYLIDAISKRGGIPFVKIENKQINSKLVEVTEEDRINLLEIMENQEVEMFDSFIKICNNMNSYELKDNSKQLYINKRLLKSKNIRVNERKWVLLNYPSVVDAYNAKMNTLDFYNHAFNVMTFDYNMMSELIKPLKDLMDRTDKVRIVSPNTDLTFSIKGMKSVPCCGKMNIPDGELYSCPIRDSVNGYITYNTPSTYMGNVFSNIRLEFKDGKIISATCNGDNEKLNRIFDIDEGARYIGEFSLGFNPLILEPINDILFDEKIIGSLHFTPGAAYKDCYNGNDSAIHWDLVLIQREDYGGGEIYFDDILVRKDGKFVLEELKPLNFEKITKN